MQHNNYNNVKIILMFAPEYPPHNIGGGGVVVQNLARELSKLGYRVVVLAGYYKSRNILDRPWLQQDGDVLVVWLPLLPTPKVMQYLYTVMPPNLYSAILLFKLLNKMSRFRECIVHLHGYGHLLIDYVALLLKEFGKPYILTVHGIPKSPFYLDNKFLKIAFALYTKFIGRRTIENAAKITAISKSIAKEIIAYGAKPSQIIIIPNGIDPHYADNILGGIFRKKYNIPPEKKIILCIGRLHPRKGFQYVILTMPYILKEEPDALLVIVGDGPYKEVLMSLAKRLGIENYVLFTGYVDEQTKKEALADADIIVIPSLIEPFGLVALEGMIMKKPVVASNIDGLKELIQPYNILLFNIEDVYDLKSKIFTLLRRPNLSKFLSEKLYEKAINYSWKKVVYMYLHIYNTVLSCKNRKNTIYYS